MLGVDKLDQLISYYSFLHESVKWWRKVFFWLLDMTVVNSYIIHQHTQCETNTKMTHLEFRRQLIRQLVEPLQTLQCVPRSVSSHERLNKAPHFLEKKSKRRDCAVCSDRAEEGKRHLTPFVCTTCTDTPPLCPDTCFKLYHTQRNYKIS